MQGLIVETGARRGQVFEFTEGVMTVGRSAGCTIHIESDDVSREHARIIKEGGRCVLEDLGSRNGTHVNGVFIKKRVLKDGDKVSIGNIVMRFAETLKPDDRTLPRDVVEVVGDPDAPRLNDAAARYIARDAETSPWAIASLACLLAGIFWPFAALAIVLGVMALLKIKERGDQKGSQLAVAAIVLGALLSAYHAYDKGIRTALVRARANKVRIACRGNLNKIGLALAQYSADTGGDFPTHLTDLYPQYLQDKAVFVCPGDHSPYIASNNISCSYEYVRGHGPENALQSILVYDQSPANHFSEGRNALFTDFHVEWLEEAEILERLKSKSNP